MWLCLQFYDLSHETFYCCVSPHELIIIIINHHCGFLLILLNKVLGKGLYILLILHVTQLDEWGGKFVQTKTQTFRVEYFRYGAGDKIGKTGNGKQEYRNKLKGSEKCYIWERKKVCSEECDRECVITAGWYSCRAGCCPGFCWASDEHLPLLPSPLPSLPDVGLYLFSSSHVAPKAWALFFFCTY